MPTKRQVAEHRTNYLRIQSKGYARGDRKGQGFVTKRPTSFSRLPLRLKREFDARFRTVMGRIHQQYRRTGK